MTELIQVDKQALRDFIDLMQLTADDMAAVRDTTTPLYGGDDTASTDGSWRGGVRVTLGAVDYAHPGRLAGQVLADRVADTLNFAISMEEGARALGEIAEAILNALNNQDEIAADELQAIMATARSQEATNPYGVPDVDETPGLKAVLMPQDIKSQTQE